MQVPNELYKAYKEGATFENQKEALASFVQNTIQPIADDLANNWTSQFGLKDPLVASFDHLPAMQHNEGRKADKTDKIASAIQKMVNAGLSTEDINSIFISQGIEMDIKEIQKNENTEGIQNGSDQANQTNQIGENSEEGNN